MGMCSMNTSSFVVVLDVVNSWKSSQCASKPAAAFKLVNTCTYVHVDRDASLAGQSLRKKCKGLVLVFLNLVAGG